MFEDKIALTKKELNDKHHNLKNLLLDQNDKFKLVKVKELDERIKDTKEQSQNEITKLEKRVEVIEKIKPLQFPITFTADEVSSKNVVNTFNIFDINEIIFKLKMLDDKIIIDNDNFIRF